MKKCLLSLAIIISYCLQAQSIDTDLIEKKLTVQEMRADLDTLHEWLTKSHPDLYQLASKVQTEAQWEAVKKSFTNPLYRLQFLRLAAPLLAQYKDGHTSFWTEFDLEEFQQLEQQQGQLLPLFVTIYNNRIFVQSSTMADIQKGDEVLSINKKSVPQILKELIPTLPGDAKQYSIATLSRLFSFLLWLNYGWKNEFDIEIKSGKNRALIRTTGISVANYLQHLFVEIPNWELTVHPQHKLAVLTVNRYGQVSKAKAFIDSSFAVIKQQGIEHVALDLRQNGGGNSAIGSYILSYITRKPINATASKTIKDGPVINRQNPNTWQYQLLNKAKEQWTHLGNGLYKSSGNVQMPDSVKYPSNLFAGQFYLFTGPVTYSSAHMTALSVKCNQLGLIIGEPTGERINLTGEAMDMQLPNSKFYVSIPAAAYEGACGNTSKIGVQPDVVITKKEKDVRSGNDPVLNYLLSRLKATVKN